MLRQVLARRMQGELGTISELEQHQGYLVSSYVSRQIW